MTDELTSFETFPETLQQGIADLGWKDPMPVQRRVTPVMRRGSDIIAQAVTGSGKTGAFGLPIIEQIDTGLKAAQALVLAPTRELAIQIAQELAALSRHTAVETFPIYGGAAYGPQLEALDRGVQLLCGTPGRVLDHLKSGRMKLDRLRFLIFDEADELLSLGFWPDMKEIKKFIPEKRQTGLFSATMPERVRSLARFFLHEPEFVSLTEGGVRSPEEIEHYHYIVSANEKDKVLLRILEYEDPDSAIIFCNTRDDVRFVTAFLQRNYIDADMIQGEMSQGARERVMRRIKAGQLRFLVATDVAARGIDISDLSHVISYSSGDSPEVYLHRTGRTGRAGKTGTAISLVSGLDVGNFKNTQAVNRMTIPERQLPSAKEVEEHVQRRIEVQIEHAFRELPERERLARQQKMLPIVRNLAESETGLAQLAVVLFDHIYKQRGGTDDDDDAPQESAPEPQRADAPEGDDRPRRRRRRRRPSSRSKAGS